GVVAIAAGAAHGIALRSDRTVFCWGDNSLNQSVVPPGTANIIAIAGGATHTVALRMAPPAIVAHPTPRTVLRGQSTTFNATFTGSTPLNLQWRQNNVAIPNATNASYTIASAQPGDAGNYTIVVGNAVGTAQSTNALLTVNVPAGVIGQPTSQQVIAGDSATFTVTAEGTAPIRYRWQKEGTNIITATNASYNISSATTNHAGDYRCVVSNAFGMATSLVATLTVFPVPVITAQPQSQTVLAGGSVTFRVGAENATAFQWRKANANIPGANQSTYTLNPVGTNDAGGYRVVLTNQYGAVTSLLATLTVNVLSPGESTIVQWGEDPVFNGSDQIDIGVPDGLTDVASMAAGAYHDLVLLRNGRVFGWGDNLFGQASSPTSVTNGRAVSAGMQHSVALTSNGTVVAWGRNNLKQTDIPAGLSGVAAIAAGANHTLALRSNGTVVAWGYTNAGQSLVPSNTTNVMTIAAGFEHSIAVLSNGTLRTWGNNDFGQRIPPFPLSNVVAVAAGKYHSVALRNDGRVFAWGQNTFGQTNLPAGLQSGVTAIAAGDNHSLALRADGTMIAWGQDNFLQLHAPADLAGVVAIAAGGNRSLARKTRLRLGPPEHLANGAIRLRVATKDGSTIDPARVPKLEIYVSANPTLPVAQWTKRNISFVVVNGALQGDDLPPLPNMRFYIAVEQP
ncbi:MAG TPA: immunoglobulin domain-containing protein, partial [Verrucomicrobiae bacterium]|nr:immunoglobulin domain-containing protein [Verrucomicrobiae bacterium]